MNARLALGISDALNDKKHEQAADKCTNKVYIQRTAHQDGSFRRKIVTSAALFIATLHRKVL